MHDLDWYSVASTNYVFHSVDYLIDGRLSIPRTPNSNRIPYYGGPGYGNSKNAKPQIQIFFWRFLARDWACLVSEIPHNEIRSSSTDNPFLRFCNRLAQFSKSQRGSTGMPTYFPNISTPLGTNAITRDTRFARYQLWRVQSKDDWAHRAGRIRVRWYMCTGLLLHVVMQKRPTRSFLILQNRQHAIHMFRTLL